MPSTFRSARWFGLQDLSFAVQFQVGRACWRVCGAVVPQISAAAARPRPTESERSETCWPGGTPFGAALIRALPASPRGAAEATLAGDGSEE